MWEHRSQRTVTRLPCISQVSSFRKRGEASHSRSPRAEKEGSRLRGLCLAWGAGGLAAETAKSSLLHRASAAEVLSLSPNPRETPALQGTGQAPHGPGALGPAGELGCAPCRVGRPLSRASFSESLRCARTALGAGDSCHRTAQTARRR